jgi:hypothetical protein
MNDLSGYKLTNAWFEFCQSGTQITRPVHTALYLYCIHLCNKLKWREIYGLPTEATMASLGISSYKTYINTLTDLVDFGFITWVEKSKNQYTSNKIALVKNAKARPKHIPKHVQSIVPIVKHVNNKNVLNVQTLKTGLVEIFKTVRSDVPRETLEIEAGMFIAKYPGKGLQKDINLITTWAKRIKFIQPINHKTEFDKIAAKNKERYGT